VAVENASDQRTSRLARAARFAFTHPVGIAHTILYMLVAVVVLQNLEPTTIDLLFWSIPEVPKLAVLLLAMLLGAILWELARRLIRR
jgi:uncharacterized integral membrane protein